MRHVLNRVVVLTATCFLAIGLAGAGEEVDAGAAQESDAIESHAEAEHESHTEAEHSSHTCLHCKSKQRHTDSADDRTRPLIVSVSNVDEEVDADARDTEDMTNDVSSTIRLLESREQAELRIRPSDIVKRASAATPQIADAAAASASSAGEVWISDALNRVAQNRDGSGTRTTPRQAPAPPNPLQPMAAQPFTAQSFAGQEDYYGASDDTAYISDGDDSLLGSVMDEVFWNDPDEVQVGDCGGDDCGGCNSCAAAGAMFGNLWYNKNREYVVWGRLEYLYWEGKGDRLPSLVTTSPNGTPQTSGGLPDAGALGRPTTSVLFGDARFNGTERNGGRISVGYGLFNGVQGDYYRLENSVSAFSVTSDGDPILARPFENVSLMANDALLVAFPNFVDVGPPMQMFDLVGNITIKATSDVQSAGASFRRLVWMESNDCFDGFWRLNFIGGYRYFELDDSLTIADTRFPIGGFFANGTSFSNIDQFTTENEFHGGEIGLLFTYQKRRFSLDVKAKVALGNMHRSLEIAGVSNVFDPVTMTNTTTPGGLLARQTNIGRHSTDEFAVIPEVGIDLGIQLLRGVKLTGGYTFIYASQTRRPGDSIDLLVNPTDPLVGAARPTVLDNDSYFWLQGFNGGVEISF